MTIAGNVHVNLFNSPIAIRTWLALPLARDSILCLKIIVLDKYVKYRASTFDLSRTLMQAAFWLRRAPSNDLGIVAVLPTTEFGWSGCEPTVAKTKSPL